MTRARSRILISILAAIAFLPLLGRRDINTSHEARVVQTARAMAAAGWPWQAQATPILQVSIRSRPGQPLDVRPDPDLPPILVNPWLVPTLNGEIRLQKPPLPYWCAALLFRLVGDHPATAPNPATSPTASPDELQTPPDWSPLLARLPAALLGFFATFLIADLARITLGRRFATPAALVWASLHFAPDEFRKSMADPYLAFFTLLTAWSWIRAAIPSTARCRPQSPSSIFHLPSSPSLFILLAYLSLSLGLLSKGPPIFITLLPPIILFHLLCKKRGARFPRPWPAHIAGVVLLAIITLPWPIYVFKTVPHALDIWRFESIGEVTGENTNNVRPWHHYLPLLPLHALPWTPIWIAALALPFLKRSRRPKPTADHSALSNDPSNLGTHPSQPRFRNAQLLFPLLSHLIPVLIFSLVKLKKGAYLLPATPFLAISIALTLVTIVAAARRFGPRSLAAFLLAGQSVVPLVLSAAIPILAWKSKLPLLPTTLSLLPLAIAILALLSLTPRRRPAPSSILHSFGKLRTGLPSSFAAFIPLIATSATLALALLSATILTPLDNRRSPRPAAATLLAALRAHPGSAVVPDVLPAEATCYLPLTLPTPHPETRTLFHLSDDPRQTARTPTPESLRQTYPTLLITDVTPIPISLPENARPRYKLYKLTLTPQKVYAGEKRQKDEG